MSVALASVTIWTLHRRDRRPRAASAAVSPPATRPFADVEAVFGTKGDPAHCWCQWYKIPGSDWRQVRRRGAARSPRGAAARRRRRGPGLLAYDGDTPVGWCAVEPRAEPPPAPPQHHRRRRHARSRLRRPERLGRSPASSCRVRTGARGVGSGARRSGGRVRARARRTRRRGLRGRPDDAREDPRRRSLPRHRHRCSSTPDSPRSPRPKPDRAIMQVRLQRAVATGARGDRGRDSAQPSHERPQRVHDGGKLIAGARPRARRPRPPVARTRAAAPPSWRDVRPRASHVLGEQHLVAVIAEHVV